ncbi:cation:proton antiporter [Pseudokineococcus lusitanus]|uniref:cation:proton antiporter domain-containing protein n=1 Tax=Pseudokineococcus lusitanus TaxID=763993 RepID=UPI000F4A99CB
MRAVEVAVAVVAAGTLAVALAAAAAPRLGLPAPLVLLALGVVVSVLPFVPVVSVPPELVLTGILPALLYAAAVSVPAMDLRRDAAAVSALSVVLVLVSALVVGAVLTLLVPGLPYAWGVAVGAVVSPTDAVATAVVRRSGVSHRVTAIMEGESLLNDASALVLVRAAVAAAAGAVSFWGVAGQFVWTVVAAVAVGLLAGHGSLRLRARLDDPTVTTAVSFTTPFVAALPAEAVGGSGLVAAVVAGLVVGRNAPRLLGPQHRRSETENWATVSLVLEGAVFLLMGLEIAGIVDAAGGVGVVGRALGIAAVVLVVVLAVRAAVVVPLLGGMHLGTRRVLRARGRVEDLHRRLLEGEEVELQLRRRGDDRPVDPARLGRRLQSVLAGIDYLAAYPLGPREGAVVVWAGMRGAVTVAAAQTLPTGADGPEDRSLLLLVAFGVAALSLVVQGGTLGTALRWLRPAAEDPASAAEERAAVLRLVRGVAEGVAARPDEPAKQHRLRQLRASRVALLDARDLGVHDAEVLGAVLDAVDAEQVALELRGGPAG